jgi:predicted TIM-barrel fold metal-dependent hydrolase
MPNHLSRRDFARGIGAAALATSLGCQSEAPPAAETPAPRARKIIDPHVHVWTHDPQYPFPEGRKPPEEEALPETLLQLMEQNGVAHTVIVHPINYLWDCRYVADVIKKYPDKFQGVCRVNPEAPDAADELTRWTQEHGYRGVRLSPSVDAQGDWIKNDKLMDPIWSRAQELKVPMLILTRGPRLPDVEKLIARYPDLDISIDHMSDIKPTEPDLLPNLLGLAKYPRV